jgi:hypothetical protein
MRAWQLPTTKQNNHLIWKQFFFLNYFVFCIVINYHVVTRNSFKKPKQRANRENKEANNLLQISVICCVICMKLNCVICYMLKRYWQLNRSLGDDLIYNIAPRITSS